MELQPSKAPQDRPKRGFLGVILWILLWGTIFGLGGVALVAVTNKAVIWSSSDAFCGTFCHSMTWVSAAYIRFSEETLAILPFLFWRLAG